MKKMVFLFIFALGTQGLLANQVFYRAGLAHIGTHRGNQIFTDTLGAAGLNNDDKGMSLGAGLNLNLLNCPLIKGNQLLGEIFISYTKYSEEKVSSTAHYLATGGTVVKKEVNVSELAVTIAPKYKMNFGRLSTWVIPVGLSFLVNAPPSDTTNYLDIGYHAGVGIEYKLLKELSFGFDFRYTKGAGDPDFKFESKDIGAYLAINF